MPNDIKQPPDRIWLGPNWLQRHPALKVPSPRGVEYARVLPRDPLDEKAIAHLVADIRAGINSTDPVDIERATIALEALESELRAKWGAAPVR